MSLSTMVAVVLPALLVMMGLVVDGGAHAAAQSRAERLAAAAARAASDRTASARLAGAEPSVALAVAAAQAVIATAPEVRAEVSVANGRVDVRTTENTPTVLLSLIGISQLTAHGSAQAELIADR